MAKFTNSRYVTDLSSLERELAGRVDQRWFGHVESIDEYRMARRVLMTEVNRKRVRSKPRLGWMDGVKVALISRGMTMESGRQDRKDWRTLVHM